MYEPCIISGKRGVKSLFNQPDVPTAAAGGRQPPETWAMSWCQWFPQHLAVQIASSMLWLTATTWITQFTRHGWDFQSDKPRLQQFDLFKACVQLGCPQWELKSVLFVRQKKKNYPKHCSQTTEDQFNNNHSWIGMLSKSCLGVLSSWVCKGSVSVCCKL